jgi:uncharacterized damage-inducible protein DinB
MPIMLAPMLDEFRNEAAVTRRVLDRVPADKLTWKPHPKSMSLGQLAHHIATVPGGIAKIVQLDSFEVSPDNFVFPQPNNTREIHEAFEQSVRDAEACLSGMTDQAAQSQWRLTHGKKVIFDLPRAAVLRMIMLSHWYHHRGQLSVYLRMLDVPIPSIYGPSADESPLA